MLIRCVFFLQKEMMAHTTKASTDLLRSLLVTVSVTGLLKSLDILRILICLYELGGA